MTTFLLGLDGEPAKLTQAMSISITAKETQAMSIGATEEYKQATSSRLIFFDFLDFTSGKNAPTI